MDRRRPDDDEPNWSHPLHFPDPAGSFGIMWAPGANANSEVRWKPSAEFVQTWERFRFSTELDARKKADAELMEIVRNDLPVLVLYRPYESYGMKKPVNWAPKSGHIQYVLDVRATGVSLAQAS